IAELVAMCLEPLTIGLALTGVLGSPLLCRVAQQPAQVAVLRLAVLALLAAGDRSGSTAGRLAAPFSRFLRRQRPFPAFGDVGDVLGGPADDTAEQAGAEDDQERDRSGIHSGYSFSVR